MKKGLRTTSRAVPLFALLCLCPTMWGADVTLNALTASTITGNADLQLAVLNAEPDLGAAFVIYCNDGPASLQVQANASRLSDTTFLSQVAEITAQSADRQGNGSLVLSAYERAAHLAMRFARSPSNESASGDRQYAEIDQLLWRLFIAARDVGTDLPPGLALDWVTLSNDDRSSFDFSKWQF